MRIPLLLLSAGVILAQTLEPYEVPEAYEVYSAILPDEWPSAVNHESELNIIEETKFQPMCLEPAGKSKALLGPVIADYVRVNQKRWLLQRKFVLAKPYAFVSKANSLVRSVTELSAAGFNADKTITKLQ